MDGDVNNVDDGSIYIVTMLHIFGGNKRPAALTHLAFPHIVWMHAAARASQTAEMVDSFVILKMVDLFVLLGSGIVSHLSCRTLDILQLMHRYLILEMPCIT